MSKLKPYKVGEYDMVAAENSEQALSAYENHLGTFEGMTIDDVEDMSGHLDMEVKDEDGNSTGTIRDYVEKCNGKPSYIYGWE